MRARTVRQSSTTCRACVWWACAKTIKRKSSKKQSFFRVQASTGCSRTPYMTITEMKISQLLKLQSNNLMERMPHHNYSSYAITPTPIIIGQDVGLRTISFNGTTMPWLFSVSRSWDEIHLFFSQVMNELLENIRKRRVPRWLLLRWKHLKGIKRGNLIGDRYTCRTYS